MVKMINFLAVTIVILYKLAHIVYAEPVNEDHIIQAIENEFPFVVSISYKEREWDNFCTGSLITNKHVLIAAHCLQNLNKKDVEILAGSYDLTSPHIKKFNIKSYLTYEDWAIKKERNFDKELNDVAIITLDVQDTAIPHANILYVKARILKKTDVVLAGWGALSSSHQDPKMGKISLRVLSKKKCIENIKLINPKMKDIESKWKKILRRDDLLCSASYPCGSLLSFDGFSGGPILDKNKNLVAIHMAMCPKQEGRKFSIEVNMDYYKHFINDATHD